MMRITALASALAAAVVALSCASGERLTIDQYAEVCADGIASAQTLIEPESITWGELASVALRSAELMRDVEPPAELSEFHRATRKTLDFVADVAGDQSPDELANPLVFGLEAIQIATQLRRAIDDLPIELRRTLSEAGCL